MATVTMEVRIDSGLKERAEAVLAKLHTTMEAYTNIMLEELVRDYEIPVSPYLSTPATVEDDLRRVEEARKNGVPDIPIEEVLAELDITLEEESPA